MRISTSFEKCGQIAEVERSSGWMELSVKSIDGGELAGCKARIMQPVALHLLHARVCHVLLATSTLTPSTQRRYGHQQLPQYSQHKPASLLPPSE